MVRVPDTPRWLSFLLLLALAVVVRQAARGEPADQRLIEAQSAFDLARQRMTESRYSEAVSHAERALALRASVLGPRHPQVARVWNLLGNLAWFQGHYSQAEMLYTRALEIRQAVLPPNHPEIADSLNNLGNLCREVGRYSQAERLHQEALDIWQAVVTQQPPLTPHDAATARNKLAGTLTQLANLYYDQGDYLRAEPLYLQALTMREGVFGTQDPVLAGSLVNLADLYSTQTRYAEALPLYERALAMSLAASGKDHPDVAYELDRLAQVHFFAGRYAQAEPLYRQALGIWEVALGKTHPSVADALHHLAALELATGRYGEAESDAARALAIRQATFRPGHPAVTASLGQHAALLLAQGHMLAAQRLLWQVLESSEERLHHEALDFSQARLASFLELLHSEEERLYALARSRGADHAASRLALAAALLRKGRSLGEVADISRTIYRHLSPIDREPFALLRALRTQAAALWLGTQGEPLTAEKVKALAEIEARGDALEATLAKRSRVFRALSQRPRPAEIVDRVAAALPHESMLVELVAYDDRPLVPKIGALPLAGATTRYLALLLASSGHTRLVDLGPAAAIDQAALRFYKTLARRRDDLRSAAESLYQLVFRPLKAHLGGRRRLYIAPDGELNLIPFAALHDGRRFVIDDFDITYLTSGKDLLRPSDPRPSSSVVVLADPRFDPTPAGPTSAPPSPLPAPSAPAADDALLRASPNEGGFAEIASERGLASGGPSGSWPELPGTRVEAETIARLFPHATVLLAAEANKSRLLALVSPGILHLATHGVFRRDRTPAVGSGVDPLLRSALVLAAPPGKPRLSEMMVTALELSGMNLWGTQLVVLSACDTGRGEVPRGQGVYGLRRAFLMAGAQTVVASLWQVSDRATQALMAAYYTRLRAGQGRGIALRRAMLTLRQTEPDPASWAPFIMIGRSGPLTVPQRGNTPE